MVSLPYSYKIKKKTKKTFRNMTLNSCYGNKVREIKGQKTYENRMTFLVCHHQHKLENSSVS